MKRSHQKEAFAGKAGFKKTIASLVLALGVVPAMGAQKSLPARFRADKDLFRLPSSSDGSADEADATFANTFEQNLANQSFKADLSKEGNKNEKMDIGHVNTVDKNQRYVDEDGETKAGWPGTPKEKKAVWAIDRMNKSFVLGGGQSVALQDILSESDLSESSALDEDAEQLDEERGGLVRAPKMAYSPLAKKEIASWLDVVRPGWGRLELQHLMLGIIELDDDKKNKKQHALKNYEGDFEDDVTGPDNLFGIKKRLDPEKLTRRTEAEQRGGGEDWPHVKHPKLLSSEKAAQSKKRRTYSV